MATRPTDGERLHLGTDLADGKEFHLSADWETTGIHILGPPKMGKSNECLQFYEQFCARADGPVVVWSPKGDLIPKCIASATAHGQTSRVVLFDPASEWILGYDPLKPNGLSVADHAKHVREGIRAAWGQAAFEKTPQMEWLLYVALYAVRHAELTLADAPEVLLPNSRLRKEVLRTIPDSKVHARLADFDGWEARRQLDLAGSTYARLQRFVSDPTIRRILTQRDHAIDVGQLMRERKIILLNLERNRPLRLDDIRLLGRLLLNDIVQHVFSRGPGERTPVYLLLDEAQTWVTHDLCDLLEQGRELGARVVLAHHHLEQLKLEDDDCRLLEAVLQCAETKILFGHGLVDNYDRFMPHFFLDQVDPLAIKHQETRLESEYVETTRVVESTTRSTTKRVGIAFPSTSVVGGATARVHTETEGDTESEGDDVTWLDAVGEGATVLPDGTVVPSSSTTSGMNRSQRESRSRSRSVADSDSHARNWSRAKGRVPSYGLDQSVGTSRAAQPFHEIHQRRVPGVTAFWTEAEVYMRFKQKVSALPVGQAVVKVPGKPAVFFKIPLVEPPELGPGLLRRVRARIFSAPYYAHRPDVEAKEAKELELRKDHDYTVTNERPSRRAQKNAGADTAGPKRPGTVPRNPFR